MNQLDQLRHVAGLVGIATRHVDALGVWHEPDEETLARLIAAFGLPADPRAAAEELAEEDRKAPFGLPPVHVVAQEDAAPSLPPLRLPPGADAAEWHCRLEDGHETSGRSNGAELLLPTGLPLAITGWRWPPARRTRRSGWSWRRHPATCRTGCNRGRAAGG